MKNFKLISDKKKLDRVINTISRMWVIVFSLNHPAQVHFQTDNIIKVALKIRHICNKSGYLLLFYIN